jgi:hypothetical protein
MIPVAMRYVSAFLRCHARESGHPVKAASAIGFGVMMYWITRLRG